MALKPYLHQQNSSCCDCHFVLVEKIILQGQGPIMTPGVGPYLTPGNDWWDLCIAPHDIVLYEINKLYVMLLHRRFFHVFPL